MPITSFTIYPSLGRKTAPAAVPARTYTKRRAERSADVRSVHQKPHSGVSSDGRAGRGIGPADVPVGGEQHSEYAVARFAVLETELIEPLLRDVEGLAAQLRDRDPGRLRSRRAPVVRELRHRDQCRRGKAGDQDHGGEGGDEPSAPAAPSPAR